MAKVNIDCHIAFGDRLYSVSHRYVGGECVFAQLLRSWRFSVGGGGSHCTADMVERERRRAQQLPAHARALVL